MTGGICVSRTQFTFYESFYKALARIRKGADRAKAYDAIARYALYGEEPEGTLPDSVGAVFESVRPILDVAGRKSDAGKKRKNRTKTDGSKKETEAEQTEAEPKQELEIEQDIDIDLGLEQKLISPPSPDGEVVDIAPASAEAIGGKAVSAYMAKISPTPSPSSMRELLEFERELGTEVCLRAIDAALDANVRTWPYVRAVLEDKLCRGIRSGEDWDRLEAARMTAKARQTAKAEGYDPEKMQAPADFGDNEALFREMEL